MLEEEFVIEEEDSENFGSGRQRFKYLKPTSVIYSSPHAKVIATERSDTVRRRMIELYSLLKPMLSIVEIGFLKSALGHSWEKELSLPSLESVNNVKEYLDKRISSVKERIQILMDATISSQIPIKKSLYLSQIPHFLMTEEEIIKMYEIVLRDKTSFPLGFFKYDNGRKAGILTRYMCEEIRGYKPEETFSRATKMDFSENRLEYMLNYNFKGDTKNAIRNAYPKSKYPTLYEGTGKMEKGQPYAEKQRSSNGLSHLVDSLDDIFGSR